MFRMTRRARWEWTAVVAGLLTVAATSTVSASHDSYRVHRGTSVCQVKRPVATRAVRRPIAWRHQYQRGWTLGRKAGYSAGYEAGLHGLKYCTTPAPCGKGRSRHFRRGWASGYAKAYAAGYRQGRRDRRPSWCVSFSW